MSVESRDGAGAAAGDRPAEGFQGCANVCRRTGSVNVRETRDDAPSLSSPKELSIETIHPSSDLGMPEIPCRFFGTAKSQKRSSALRECISYCKEGRFSARILQRCMKARMKKVCKEG
ncbi:hypothetical protein EVAR_74651_1 [Eumeta japonica]|uniref:Uncharacterized protein n=1 Tax=Eumeta variegata TaxID=151549 RepID=A0A4C1W9R9_EUMVA|nr:hypothetical protein EVAR_74651_1 [Eumeta japonica]